MADEKTNAGQDCNRSDLNEAYEVRDWTHSLSVSEHELRNAVAVVGDRADGIGGFPTGRCSEVPPIDRLGKTMAVRRSKAMTRIVNQNLEAAPL
jgi:hypothetical protein